MADSATSTLADGIRYLRGGMLDRAGSCFEQAAERAEEPSLRSEALRRLADVKRRRAEWDQALELSASALQIAMDNGLTDEGAAARNIEGTIHLQRGEFHRAIDVYQQALATGPGAHQRALICQNLGTAFAQNGVHTAAAEWYALSSAAFRRAGRRREALLAMINQGNVKLDAGELVEAEELFREAIDRVDALADGDAELRGLIEMNLAEALGRQGIELERAMDMVLSATGHFVASENRPYRVACHRVLALISERRGDRATAIGALERGEVLACEIGSGPEIAYFRRELTRIREEKQETSTDTAPPA